MVGFSKCATAGGLKPDNGPAGVNPNSKAGSLGHNAMSLALEGGVARLTNGDPSSLPGGTLRLHPQKPGMVNGMDAEH